jgi:magnesium transporter
MSDIKKPSALTFQGADATEIASKMESYHAADVVEMLNELEPTLGASVLEKMPFERATQILGQSGFEQPQKLIEQLRFERAAAILGAMSADRRADIFRRIPESLRTSLAAELPAPVRATLEKLLSYPPTSAGGIMTTEFVGVPANWTVSQVLEHIRTVGDESETIYAIYVVDPHTRRLARAISLRQIILSDGDASVADVGPPRKPIAVSPLTDREQVARLISKYDLLAVPVLDDAGQVPLQLIDGGTEAALRPVPDARAGREGEAALHFCQKRRCLPASHRT